MIEIGTTQFWRATFALCLGSFMVFANVYVTQPLLPTLAAEFEISPLKASWSLTVTTLTLGLSLLFFGPLSDALGRTRLMIASMVGVVICGVALSLVTSFEQLFLLRAIQGVCLAGLPAIAIAYMGDEFHQKAVIVAVGLYISGNTIGGIGGRLIGGFVGELLGWQEVFVVMSLMSACCLAVFIYLLPPSRQFSAKPLRPKGILLDIVRHLQNPLLLLACLIGGFNFFIFINQYSYVTFLLAAAPYHLSASLLGMLFLTYLSGTIGSAISGRLSLKFTQPVVIAMGTICIMIGSLVTLIPSILAIVVGFLINAFGFFVAHSTASSWVSRHAKNARATASSLYLVFYYLGASTGGFYLNPFWQFAGWKGIVLGSLCVLTLTFILAVVLQCRFNKPQ